MSYITRKAWGPISKKSARLLSRHFRSCPSTSPPPLRFILSRRRKILAVQSFRRAGEKKFSLAKKKGEICFVLPAITSDLVLVGVPCGRGLVGVVLHVDAAEAAPLVPDPGHQLGRLQAHTAYQLARLVLDVPRHRGQGGRAGPWEIETRRGRPR